MEPSNTCLRYGFGGTSTERLRTQRIQVAVPVILRGGEGNRSFEEAAHSVSVNAYGGILRLSTQVTLTQRIMIFNPETAGQLSGMVTFVGLTKAGKTDICIEFSEPSVSFWGIPFPGWSLAHRKGRTQKSQGQK